MRASSAAAAISLLGAASLGLALASAGSAQPAPEPARTSASHPHSSAERRMLLGAPLALLARPDVQDDLGLAPRQRDRLRALEAGLRGAEEEAPRAAARGATAGRKSEREPASDRASRLEREIAAYEREAGAILTGPQRRRLRQIQLQIVGNLALLEPSVQQELGLDADARGALERASQEHVRAIEALRSALARGEVDPQEYRKRVAALARKLDAELSRAVPDEVLARLRALEGRPFSGAAALRSRAR